MAKETGSDIIADGTASTKTYTEKQVILIASGVAILSALMTLLVITSPDTPDWKQVFDHMCSTYVEEGSVYYKFTAGSDVVVIFCRQPIEEDFLVIPTDTVGEFDYGIH